MSPIEIYVVNDNGEIANLNQEGLYETLIQRALSNSGNASAGASARLNVILFDLASMSM